MKRRKTKIVAGVCMGFFVLALNGNGVCVRAKESVKYQYDALGRMISAQYSNGAEYQYEYDRNGNIVSVRKVKSETTTEKSDTEEGSDTEETTSTTKEPSEEKTTSTTKESGTDKTTSTTKEPSEEKTTSTTKESGTDKTTSTTKEPSEEKTTSTTKESGTEKTTGTTKEPSTEKTTSTAEQLGAEQTNGITDGASTEQKVDVTEETNIETSAWNQNELRQINQFRRKRPVIKSLSARKRNGKIYMNIQIRQMIPIKKDGENGYQIRYASNKRFKHCKRITVKRKLKGKATKRNCRIQKNQTYYVKVRAYRILRTGKTIYSKYSKVKKIRIGK